MGIQKIPPDFIPFVISNYPKPQIQRFFLFLFHEHSALTNLPFLSSFLLNTDFHDLQLFMAITGPQYLFQIIFDVLLIRLNDVSNSSLLENPFFRHTFFLEVIEGFLFTQQFDEFMSFLIDKPGKRLSIFNQ